MHADADEFWTTPLGSIKRALAGVPERYDVVLAPRPEFVPRPESEAPFYERLVIRERHSRLRPKIAHRARADVELHQGAHDVGYAAAANGSIVRGRRAMTRFTHSGPEEDHEDPVWAPYWPLRVLHLPLRSYEQYRRRVETVLFHGDPPMTETRRLLRRRYNHGRLEQAYRRLIAADDEIQRRIEEGDLVEDTSLRDAIAALPAGPPPIGEAEEAAELAEIEFDAMQAIARSQRQLGRRIDRLQERSRQRKARFDSGGGTLPGRLLLRLRRRL